jgi:glutathione S-transferase
MTPTITAFADSPDGGVGLARDMRVRWALEEVGQPYDVKLVSFGEMKQPAHLSRNPFGQIPTFEDGALKLFESGAIIFHIAEQHPGLLPTEPQARMRAIMWMFAALSTLEPPIIDLEQSGFIDRGQPWESDARMEVLKDRIRVRLQQLADWLGDSDWLDGDFSAGDLMMIMVLRRLEGDNLVEDYPTLVAYMARGMARPAYGRAYDAQHQVYLAASAAR